MDPREPARLDDVACGVCREPVAHDQARLLATREDLAVVELRCRVCASVTLGFVFTPDIHDAIRAHSRPAAPPVSADDVLDMHLHLEAWQGDLQSLVDGRQARRPGREQ
jgi:hypothetical protein